MSSMIPAKLKVMTSSWRHLRQIRRLLQHLERTCMVCSLKRPDQGWGTSKILVLEKVHHLKKIMESPIYLANRSWWTLQWMFHKLQGFRDWGKIHFSRLSMRLKGMREWQSCLERVRLEGQMKQKTPYQLSGHDHRLLLKMPTTVSDFKIATKTTMANGIDPTIESSTWPAKETFSPAEAVTLSVIRPRAEATEWAHFHHPSATSASTPLVLLTSFVLRTEAASTQKHQKHSLKPQSLRTKPIKKSTSSTRSRCTKSLVKK